MIFKFMEEMKKVGISENEIIIFGVIGVTCWAVLLWLFVDRYQRINDTPSDERSEEIRDLAIIIISFHVATIGFTLLESYYMNRNIWVSWFTIGLALTTIFLNAVVVANVLSTSEGPNSYKDREPKRDIASLIIQVFSVCLMTAYIFKLIRSKNKVMY